VVPILAANVPDKAVTIVVTCLMLAGAFILLGIGVWLVRRWQRSTKMDASAPWTFDDLRKLRDQGKLTEAEYQTLRGEIIGMCTKEVHPAAPSAVPPPRNRRPAEEEWDWVAEDKPGSNGFDVKKPSPD
jgi:hypothetical protein